MCQESMKKGLTGTLFLPESWPLAGRNLMLEAKEGKKEKIGQ